MQSNGDNINEYIAICADKIALAAKDPKATTDLLECSTSASIRVPIGFHAPWFHFIRNDDGIMCMQQAIGYSWDDLWLIAKQNIIP